MDQSSGSLSDRAIRLMVLVVGLVVSVFLIAFWPLNIYPRFSVNSASLNSLQINGSRITTEWDIKFEVYNPNFLKSVSYDVISINITYNDEHYQKLLTTTLLAPFSQVILDTDNRRVQLNMDVDDDMTTDIAAGSSRGTINFGIVLSTSVKFKTLLQFSTKRPLKVVCEPLSFVPASPGSSNWNLSHDLKCH